MSKQSFNRGEVLTAAKMNALSDRIEGGRVNAGGVRSTDGVTPLKSGMPRALSDEIIYEATADAVEVGTELEPPHYWSVTVKEVALDGSLNDKVLTFRAIGDPETTDAPILEGDRCAVMITGDNREVVVATGQSSGRGQLDHAFLPTQDTATEATLTPGYVTDRNGTRRSITTATTVGAAWAGGVIDFTTDKCWWVQIKYEPTEGSTQGEFLELRWEKGASFPAHRAGIGAALGYTINIPVIEFVGVSPTWSDMIRRQTNDIIDSPHSYDDLNDAPSTDEPWPEPPPYDTIQGTPDIPDDQDGFDTGTPPANRRHYNLSSLTERDDHHGERTAVSGTTGKNVYLHPEGNATRNAMSGLIGASDNTSSIGPTERTLYAGAGESAMIWGIRCCYSSPLLLSIDWSNRKLHDELEEQSANWDTRKLYDNFGVESADWHFGWLRVSATETSINWKDRVLQSSGLATIEWEHGRINGDNGEVSIQWFDRTLNDAGGAVVLNWLLRQLAGGDWDVTAGDFDVSGTGKVYRHGGTAGVTGSGFSGGIKTGEGSEEAYQESAVDVTLTAASSFANMTATATATLPASVAGRRFTIAATAAGGATVAANGTELINGQATQTLSQYDAMTVIGTGTGWIII